MKPTGLLLFPCLLAMAAAETPLPLQPSAVWRWEDMAVKPTGVGERRDITDLPTVTLARFESHVTTLNPGLASHLPHTHPQEEVIVLKEGVLDVHINGVVERAGPGSLLFFASNDPHAVRNAGDTPATYLVFNFATAVTGTLGQRSARGLADPAKMGSGIHHWDRLEAKPTATGERRAVFDSPTTTIGRFSCHATTLRPGIASHPAHRHPDEEIVIVKEGLVEVTINGRVQRGGPGSIFFFGSNDEHGMRNAGEAMATYYVLRLVTEKTPARAQGGG